MAPTPPNKTANLLKFIGLIVFALIIVGLTIALIPQLHYLTSQAGREQLIAMIQGAGPLGILVVLALQFLQVVVAFIPGEVVQVATGAIYGPLWGSVLALVGGLIAGIFIFWLVRKLGSPFVDAMLGKSKNKVAKFLEKDSQGLDTLVFVLYLIPGIPKDVLTYLFPLTKVKPLNFFIFCTIARIPGVVLTSFFGSAAAGGNYAAAIAVAAVAVVVAVLAIVFQKRLTGWLNHFSHRD
ncbi:MAG: TVP38/TMEM64 family protein [Coriobacteriales bacterium]|nr:TVP38/TMEM64 family protein [Coriobacteriales bacterium]